jgi:hypothetical protein
MQGLYICSAREIGYEAELAERLRRERDEAEAIEKRVRRYAEE